MKKVEQYPITCWCGVHENFVRGKDGEIDVARFEEMKEAGINLVLAMYDPETNKQVLDVTDKLGLYVTIGDDRIAQALYDDEHRRELLAAVVNDYKGHESLFNYHITDEPNSGFFPKLAAVREVLSELDPVHEAYINLFPNYASNEMLGNPSYYAHVEQFINDVKPEIVSYDHYHFLKGAPKEKKQFEDERERQIYESAFSGGNSEYELVDRAGFFTNIDEIRELSLKYDVPFMVIILVVEHGPYRYLTEAEIRWEVWQSLAYGSERISYFTYWTPGVGNSDSDDFWHWKNGMITKDGKRTAHYDMIKEINAELAAVGGQLMGKRSQAVFHIGEMPQEKLTYWQGAYGGVDSVKGDKLTLGFFEGGYLLIANRDYLKESDVELSTGSALEIFDPAEGEWIAVETASGDYSFTIDAGDAILVRLVKKIF